MAWHKYQRSAPSPLMDVVRAVSLYHARDYSLGRPGRNAHLIICAVHETRGGQLQQLLSQHFASPRGERRKSEITQLISVADTKKD